MAINDRHLSQPGLHHEVVVVRDCDADVEQKEEKELVVDEPDAVVDPLEGRDSFETRRRMGSYSKGKRRADNNKLWQPTDIQFI